MMTKLKERSMESVKCPACKTEVKWDQSSPFRPFCSERCKMMDFGAWASNAYTIPHEPVDPDELEHLIQQNNDMDESANDDNG